MIKVENLHFEYPPNFKALTNISFEITPNSITALVGPNGAGKTTLLRCLAALEQPFSGRIKIDNLDSIKNPREIHAHIGYLSDFFGLYDELTVEQSITYIALSHKMAENEIPGKIKELCSNLKLEGYLKKKVSSLSRGLRQKVGIAQAIIHEPKVLLLDEPASGLDPEARFTLSKILVTLKNKGATIIVSSHILAELEDYSDEMMIIQNGKLTLKTSANNGKESFQDIYMKNIIPN